MGCVSSQSQNGHPEKPQDPPVQSSSTSTKTTATTTNTNLTNGKVVIALCSHEPLNDRQLSFEKGDKLVARLEEDDDDSCWPDWLLAYKQTDPEQKMGFIPSDFVVEDVIETEQWFFPRTSRRVAERLLLLDDEPNLARGTFLIRYEDEIEQEYSNNKDSMKGAAPMVNGGAKNYVLSIRDYDSAKSKPHVKHYRIQTTSEPNEGFFFITSPSRPRCFVRLQDLIEHYSSSSSSNGLCHPLTGPCPRAEPSIPIGPIPSFDGRCEIDRQELRFIRELGWGNFGKVYMGIYGGHKVAIKTLKPIEGMTALWLREWAGKTSSVHLHPHLMPLYGICSQGLPLLLITEHMSNGSLLQHLKTQNDQLTIADLVDMATQIASGMAHLEHLGLVHGYLAARNCLVTEHGRVVKVSDASFSELIFEHDDLRYLMYPIKWTAPEILIAGTTASKCTSKSDVWSFGVVLYELVTRGAPPYLGLIQRDIWEHIPRGYRMPKPVHPEECCPEPLYLVMLACWHREPEIRPTFQWLHRCLDQYFYDVSRERRFYELAEDSVGQFGLESSKEEAIAIVG